METLGRSSTPCRSCPVSWHPAARTHASRSPRPIHITANRFSFAANGYPQRRRASIASARHAPIVVVPLSRPMCRRLGQIHQRSCAGHNRNRHEKRNELPPGVRQLAAHPSRAAEELDCGDKQKEICNHLPASEHQPSTECCEILQRTGGVRIHKPVEQAARDKAGHADQGSISERLLAGSGTLTHHCAASELSDLNASTN